MYIALNKCFGGFSLSKEAKIMYMEQKYHKFYIYHYHDDEANRVSLEDFKLIEHIDDDLFYYITKKNYGDNVYLDRTVIEDAFEDIDSLKFRSDKVLIDVIRKLGKKANGRFADIKLVNVPKELCEENKLYIDEYDGLETLHENHRIW